MGCAKHEIYFLNYYLKEIELKLLLAGLGLTEWYGLFSDTAGISTVSMTEKSANSVLARMYQNGVIDWKEGQITVKQPYSGMLSAMLEKKKCVILRLLQLQEPDTLMQPLTQNPMQNLIQPSIQAPVRCCYIAKGSVVVMHKSQREEHALGISHMSFSDWAALIEEQVQLLEDGQCLALSCKNSENGLEYRTIQVMQKGIHACMADSKEGKHAVIPFGRDELRKKLRSL